MSRLNLFGKDWTNIVFENRNKAYGAYKLRQENSRTTLAALFIGIGTLSVVFGSSYLYASKSVEKGYVIEFPDNDTMIPVAYKGDKADKDDTPSEKKPEPKEMKKKAPAAAHTDVQKNIKYTDIAVDKDDHVKDEPLASQKDFKDDIQSGQANSEADPHFGKLKSDGAESGTSKTGGKGKTEGIEGGSGTTGKGKTDNSIVTLVQHKAMPNEGYAKFYENYTRKFATPSTEGNVSEILVKLRFVVELDGTFTDIKVLDDKFGMGNEAIRVLKTMPKWKPAEHNGKAVRSMFTLPIKIRIN